ncbi:hypothetical protein E2C01_003327 [Portunus trituberculatus]|uniref:Uncharacterized protein n=1 Tax=Portunus trituberculatus TaxID=210409 RepID=A0A5B7CM41_PORTR|nr:hypothetical protein [Portunus trituberculatus]
MQREERHISRSHNSSRGHAASDLDEARKLRESYSPSLPFPPTKPTPTSTQMDELRGRPTPRHETLHTFICNYASKT